MGVKALYRKLMGVLENIPINLNRRKIFFAEWYEILRKRELYKDVKWTKEQQIEFDSFWTKYYGRKISPRWHKLYQSINGVFDVKYTPEILYTTKLEPLGNKYFFAKSFSDKSLVEVFSTGTTAQIPKTIISCSDGILRDGKYNILSVLDAEEILSRESTVVIKPTLGGSSGQSVKVIDLKKKLGLSITELKNKYDSNFIIQSVIEPNDAFKKLHPESINTIRVTTYITNDCVKVAPISMRIGQGDSKVDNIHAGGLGVAVTNDGKLEKYAYALGYCDSKVKYEKHPDTGVVFENYQIPCIPKILENAKEMHLKLPHLKYVSWDYTVDKDNNIILIEMNLFGQGVWFPQIVSGKSLFGDDLLEILADMRMALRS